MDATILQFLTKDRLFYKEQLLSFKLNSKQKILLDNVLKFSMTQFKIFVFSQDRNTELS